MYCTECEITYYEDEHEEIEECPFCGCFDVREDNEDEEYYENLSRFGKMCHDGMEKECQEDR